MGRFAFRAHYSGALLVVVLMGDIDAAAAEALSAQLARLSHTTDLVVDVLDVTLCEAAVVSALLAAKERFEKDGWGFALVADPDGACTDAIRQAGQLEALKPFPNRQAARAALQG